MSDLSVATVCELPFPSRTLKLFTGSAGVSPAGSTVRCDDLAQHSTSDALFALRAHSAGETPALPVKSLILLSKEATNRQGISQRW